MTKKASKFPTAPALPPPEWNAEFKEPWHVDFDMEPVNDEKWHCIVTAAIPAEAQDEKYIQIYTQCVDTGLRRAVKVISMTDVVKLLKETEKPRKQEFGLKPPSPKFSQIIQLAAKFATFSDSECILPSDLMASVLKYMILNLKNENCLAKKVAAAKERKMREQNIKAKFIRSLKPYETIQEERKPTPKVAPNILNLEKPIDDEPIDGPDLYIMLVDFYDVFIFPELLKINVPCLSILKVSSSEAWDTKERSPLSLIKSDTTERKRLAINSVWEMLDEESFSSKKNEYFKNIMVLNYQISFSEIESRLMLFKNIFNELTGMQFSAFRMYKQYLKYLKELYVQRLIVSLEPLDLSKCKVYNKLCDAMITGEPLTPLLVLYAIVEQVVAGVPETESVALEYEPEFTDFFPGGSESNETRDNSPSHTPSISTSCKCKYNQYENFCEELKKNFNSDTLSEKSERTESSKSDSISLRSQLGENSARSSIELGKEVSSEFKISESLINEVISDKKTEKEMRKDKRWKTPSLCFYGDSLFLQTYFCDPRLLNPQTIIERFLKQYEISLIWKKYPELEPEKRAFYNFHFFSLWKNSDDSEEKFKLKVFFTCFSKTLISVRKSNLFFGKEEQDSDFLYDFLQEKSKNFKKTVSGNVTGEEKKDEEERQNFSEFFRKTFIKHEDFVSLTNKNMKVEKKNQLKSILTKRKTIYKKGLQLLHKNKGLYTMFSPMETLNYSQKINTSEFPKSNDVTTPREHEKQKHSQELPDFLIDCHEISCLTEHNFFSKKDDLSLIQDFKFYEKLNPNLMIQRLIEAQTNFNSVECTYFSPADNIIIIMHNDCDERGIYFLHEQHGLLTPIGFRYFYSHVYSRIKNWLRDENKEYIKFVSEITEKDKEEKEKKDLNYLARLKKEYCEMSEEKRKEYLETNVDVQAEPEISEKELDDLCVKPKPKPRNLEEKSHVATNLADYWVEVDQTKHEFYSPDGTEVHNTIEKLTYAPSRLHKLTIKKSEFTLQYNHWLDEKEINFSFTLKTDSDIIFSFYKDDSENMNSINYYITISWPTGLLIKPIFNGLRTYIKQSYLKTYRKGWDIEEEQSRCFLQNGQILVFKDNGNYDILCGSGTKYTFENSETLSKYLIISTTGEIWEVRNSGPCRNKKEFIRSNKIFIGVDPKTQETFYRREDGVFSMLWQNGSLVTNYPDGTKITSVPYYEEEEVMTEWTEEEKLYFEELETKHRSRISIQEPRSRTILRNSSIPKSIQKRSFINEGFISVMCEYVMEHPKYSTVCFNQDPGIKIKMPEQLSISIHPNGNYEVQKEREILKVRESLVQFYTYCNDCKDLSSVTLNMDSNEILCKCVDFFKKGFFVCNNGQIIFKKFYTEPLDDGDDTEFKQERKQSSRTFKKCPTDHKKKIASMQRCFAVDRDLNGLEFIHEDTFKTYCYHLPKETFFDLNTDDPFNISHTFSSPHYAIGYEKWTMEYENSENSLPVNIKKKDLKELGEKEIPKTLFKYPFPKHRIGRPQNVIPKEIINMPKVIEGRTIKCWGEDPNSIILEMKNYVGKYQKRAEQICKTDEFNKKSDDQGQDSNYVDKRLKKIALALNRNLKMYPHLGTQVPSTEKDIHYFGHYINLMDDMKDHLHGGKNILPNCKQIPKPLPRPSDLPDICEEVESS